MACSWHMHGNEAFWVPNWNRLHYADSAANIPPRAGAGLPAGHWQMQPGSILSYGTEPADVQTTWFCFSGLKKRKPHTACVLEGAVPLSLPKTFIVSMRNIAENIDAYLTKPTGTHSK